METTERTYEVIQGGVVPIKAWVNGVQLEWEARQQLINVAKMPFIHSHVAVMPDVHWGMGATIGSVIPTYKAIIPAAVGVDIGCGMMAVRTSLNANDLPENLHALRTAIEEVVPHGRTKHGQIGDKGGWHRDIPGSVQRVWQTTGGLGVELGEIFAKHPKLKSKRVNSLSHLGTLGTGNHFIEVCLDENNQVWVMLHSGSRGIGNKLGTYFINLAKEDMKKWFVNLPDSNLAYFAEGTEHFNDYWFAVDWAQRFARQNRELMMKAVLGAVVSTITPGQTISIEQEAVNCHHNYVSRENHFGKNVLVTRKGAVRAREGELGIIPGSMGVKSYIVRGKGNKDSFQSCSHGAGRAMSRSQAKREFTLEDHAKATEGVECRKDINVIDETPGAYKNIDDVMAAQRDLVDIVHTLKQVVCIKG